MRKSVFTIAAVAAGMTLAFAASAKAAVEIQVSDGAGAPGATVTIEVSLSTDIASVCKIGGAACTANAQCTGTGNYCDGVAGTQNDFAFAAPIAIAAKANGKPDCTANTDIEKGGTSFAYQPSGCTAGTSCTGARSLVLALDNTDPIPTGSVLYTCKISIASDATPGEYPLSCVNPIGGSAPNGDALAATCTDGTITVTGGGPTNTPTDTPITGGTPTDTPNTGATPTDTPITGGTPTDTPNTGATPTNTVAPTATVGTPAATATRTSGTPGTPAATATRTSGTPGTPGATNTPTRTSGTPGTPTRSPSGGNNDDDGCAIVAPAQSGSAWMLLLPAAALLWLRRRSR